MCSVSRFACGILTATNSTPLSVRFEIKATERARLSSLTITSTARVCLHRASAAASCGRLSLRPLSTSTNSPERPRLTAAHRGQARSALVVRSQAFGSVLLPYFFLDHLRGRPSIATRISTLTMSNLRLMQIVIVTPGRAMQDCGDDPQAARSLRFIQVGQGWHQARNLRGQPA